MMSWELSVLDRRWQAIDELAEHPAGVFKAECGHLLPMQTTTLYERFSGTPCEACASKQLAAARREICRQAGIGDPPVGFLLTPKNAGCPAGPAGPWLSCPTTSLPVAGRFPHQPSATATTSIGSSDGGRHSR